MASRYNLKQLVSALSARLGDRTRKLVLGSGVMAASTMISTLTRVGLIAILARIYSKDEFGIWVAITSATAVMATSDFGIGNALRNKLAELRAKGQEGDAEAKEYFLSVLYFFIGVAFIIAFILFLFKDHISYREVFKTDNIALQKQGVNILLGVQTIFLFGIPFGIGASMFFAYQESVWVGIQNIAIGIIGLILVSLLAFSNANITVTAIVFFLITFVINAIGSVYFVIKRKWNIFSFNFRIIFSRVKGLLVQSISFAVLQISGAFIYNATTLIVTANLSLANGAELNLVQKLYTFIITIYLSFYNPVWAGYADAIHRKDWSWCKKALTRTIQITSLIFSISIVIFIFYGNVFLKLLAGSSYVSNHLLFLYLGLWALFYVLYSMGVAFLSAVGKINLITGMTGIFALTYVYVGKYTSSISGIVGVALLSAVVFFILTLAAYLQAFLIIKNKEVDENY